jgi:hypothetical protein
MMTHTNEKIRAFKYTDFFEKIMHDIPINIKKSDL